jgi:hypothetical protein
LVYTAILDGPTTTELLDFSRYPAGSNHLWSASPQTPNCLNSSYVDENVACEIVTRFYNVCGIPTFSKQALLKDFFETDYFNLGVKPADAVLPGIAVNIGADIEDVGKIREQLRPLFNVNQKWARGAKVDLRLDCYELFFDVEARQLLGRTLQVLGSAIEGLSTGTERS